MQQIHIARAAHALLVVAALAVPNGCGNEGPQDASVDATSPSDALVGMLSDAEVVGVLNAAYTAQIQQAQLAVRFTTNATVSALAQRVVTNFSAAMQMSTQVAQSLGLAAEPSPLSESLTLQGNETLAILRTLSTGVFDVMYVNAQVDADQTLLSIIDNALIPSVKNAQLMAQVMADRDVVATQLAAALSVQSSLSD